METKKYRLSKYWLLGCILFLISSCDLELQESFNFKPELAKVKNFEDVTAWEWIQTRTTSPSAEILNGEELDLFIEAIILTGMENEYNGTNPDRTYLILNNNAFTEEGEILEELTGSVDGNLIDADVSRLRNLLRYHIIDTYIDQVPTLVTYGTEYYFQTLLPGEDGEVNLRRDERYRIDINRADDFPSTAKKATVRRYNYIFQYGIGHILQNYVQKTSF